MRQKNDEITHEPLGILGVDDPVLCAQYALDNNLLNKYGQKRFKRISKNQKKITKIVRHPKLRPYKYSPKYSFSIEIPKDYEHADTLDKNNKNTR